MTRRLILGICLIGLTVHTYGQERWYNRPNTKQINWGVKAGFTSSMYMVSDFKIKDVSIKEIQNNYRIGYTTSAFIRLNLANHFLQPELTYSISRGEIEFDKLGSQHPEVDPDYATITSKIHSIGVPLLYGYNFVKSGPYSMSVFGGPHIKYIWNNRNKITFDNFDQNNISEELNKFRVGIMIGVGVSISRIFFDFRYEQGLRNISKSVIYDSVPGAANGSETNHIVLNRREQILSFSLGMIF